MSLTEVKFIGLPIVQPPDEDINIDMIYSPRFKPNPDDLVLLMPVGWKSLNQHIAVIPTGGKTSMTIPSDVFKEKAGKDISFHFVYVHEQVPVGMSDPFVVDMPFDEESLHDDSLDTDLIVVNLTTAACLDDEISDGSILQSLIETDAVGDCNDKFIRIDESVHVLNVSTTAGSKSMSSSSQDKQQNEEKRLEVATDEESFLITELPSSDSHSRQSSELQVVVSKLVNEKEELQKLFQKERKITKEQEKRNEDLQLRNNLLLQENEILKETLSQRQLELKELQKEVIDPYGNLISNSEQPEEVTNSSQLQDGKYCNEQEMLSQGMKCDDSQEFYKLENEEQVSCDRQYSTHPSQSGECSLMAAFDCPVCAYRLPSATGTTSFQRHVHGHFANEKVYY